MNYLLKTIMRNLNFLNTDNNNHKSLRVRTNIGDTFLNVNLDQTYESLDILSLKIYQKDVYRLFDADYGIIVGRVTGQDVGIPNCRISVFIPTDEETIIGPTKIDDIKKIEAATLYPYQTVFDKDGNGKIYNLLPKYRRFRGLNGYPANEYGIGATPKTPVGSFFEKEEILSNESVAYVYDKYYKFSTLTNESGDYILVVPANRTYTVNMSCDITDIGKFSTTPELLKSENNLPDIYFTNDGLNINPEIPLERLPNIDIQNQTIYVKPLWSQNTDNTNVGINRLDFRILKKISPYVTVFGSHFTSRFGQLWDEPDEHSVNSEEEAKAFAGQLNTDSIPDDVKFTNSRIAPLTLRIFNIKNTVSEYDADLLNNNILLDNYNYNTDIELLPESKYKLYQKEPNVLITIPCNRNKVVTNEFGELISVADDNEAGAFTSFRGYFIVENEGASTNFTDDTFELDGTRRRGKIRLKIPQLFDYTSGKESLSWNGNDSKGNVFREGISEKWIWKHYKFDYGEVYSWSQWSTVAKYDYNKNEENFGNQTNIINFGEKILGDNNNPDNGNYSIKRPNISNQINYINFYNHLKQKRNNDNFVSLPIKNQWLNFSLFFVEFAYNTTNTDWFEAVDTHIMKYNRLRGNQYGLEDAPLGGAIPMGTPNDNNAPNSIQGLQNAFLANGEAIKTNFIKVNKEDLIKFNNIIINNEKQYGFRLPKSELKGDYLRFDNSNYNGQGNYLSNGNNTPTFISQDNGDNVGERYFLIGINRLNYDTTCIEYLFNYL